MEKVNRVKVVKLVPITSVTGETILFGDGSAITFDHDQDCCENNFADFEQIDDVARATKFNTQNMQFEAINGAGFRFGNPGKMFFVPCYSYQNGYYSCDIDIYFNGTRKLNLCCKEKIFD